ncbi:MAG: hypothetical protein R3318_05150, partial [Gammaproteobacteria bacterium]|nr:hypothetical protein [Gammaproteobacteria bacterium]
MSQSQSTINSSPGSAWNPAAAESSLERWNTLCERERWEIKPGTMELIANIFGASWYFTRFIFFRGLDITGVLESAPEKIKPDLIRQHLAGEMGSGDTETQLEILRIRKNEVMLQIFCGFLTGRLDQAMTESALTHLAEYTLITALDIVFTDEEDREHFAVLGMGRMAGEEMTFGSDLDLIFLYSGYSDDLFTRLGRQIRIFLREIASMSPAGVLYEV